MRPRLAGHGHGSAAPGALRRRVLRPPTSALGRWSLWLLPIGIAFQLTMIAAVAAGVRGDSSLILEIAFLAVPAFFTFASLIAAGVTAVLSLFRGERSASLALPIFVGAIALMFLIAELAAPH